MKIENKRIKSRDIEIIKKSIENENACHESYSRRVKVLVYYLVMFLVNKVQEPKDTVYVLNGKAELRYVNQGDYPLLYYGFFSSRKKDYFSSFANVSVLPRKDRFGYAVVSIREGIKNKLPIGYVLDYLIWKAFVQNKSVKIILNNGHYDRVTTMLAFLAHDYKKKYIMMQHGLLSITVNVPHKLPVTEVVAYDEQQKEIFQKRIIDNFECTYRIEYKSTIHFSETKKDKVRIGVIQTPFSLMDEIIELTKKVFVNEEIWVMLHPLEKRYFRSEGNVQFVHGIKEFEFDLIISGPSTLAYDYIKNGFSNPIIIFDDRNVFEGIADLYDNINVCKSISLFEKEIQKACHEKCDREEQYIRASIAMAVYNGEKYVEQQIISILQMMNENDELIISYDKSADDTFAIIKKYEQSDRRVRIVYDERHSVESNFNSAVAACRGKYIFLSDQDDVWINDKINVMVTYFENHEDCVVLISDGYITDCELNVTEGLFDHYDASASALRNFVKGTYCGCQMAFRASIKNKVWPVLESPPLPHDLWLGVKGANYGKVRLINDKLILHRIHQDNFSNSSKMRLPQVIKNRLLFLYGLFVR